jgi:hypothetical protein
MIDDDGTLQLQRLKAASSPLQAKGWMDRATKIRTWLTVMPDWLNGTDLLADKF